MPSMDATKPLVVMYCCFLCLKMVASQLEESEGWNSDKFKEEAAQTFNLVFHKYNHRVRPPQPYIDIAVDVSLRHVRHLDIRKQELQTVLDVEMNWNDTRLQWYPDKVHQISTNISNIWIPDIVYTNSVIETKVLYPTSVRISHKGYVTWTKKEVVTTLCPTQPDTAEQICPIILGFMSNSRNDQTDRFFYNMSSFSLSENFQNHEWDIIDTNLYYDISNVTDRATSIELEVMLQRKTEAPVSQGITERETEDNLHEITPNSCSHMEELSSRNGNAVNSVQFSVLLMELVMFASCIPGAFLMYR